jgi:multicomponent K+:H+ antiporter subunit D
VNHLVILPILVPLLAGTVLLLMSGRAEALRRTIGLGAALVLLPVALRLVSAVADGTHLVYELGAWPAPFGIVLVADRLAALLLLVTAVVAIASLVYAGGEDGVAGTQFQALFQFQLLGINGAFLTGDLFNLFVFFEVLLIAFYALLLHGLGATRVRAALHVVVLNLIGSALFLFAVGTLYGVTGTLNLADLARIVPELTPEEIPLVRSGALLLLGVFALKAAILPLGFWLPQAYASASAAAAALFAVLTKVGVYAILRVYPLAFGSEAGTLASVARPWVLPAAIATLVFGALGVLGARTLRIAAGWLVVYSVGTLLVAVGLFSESGYAAAVYYTAHSTIVGAALFLLSDLVARQRRVGGDRFEVVDSIPHAGLFGGIFLVAAVAVAGLPPLTGFAGKLMVLEAARDGGLAAVTWPAMLAATLLVIVALARAGSALFWRTGDQAPARAARLPVRQMTAVAALLACLVVMVVRGQDVTGYAWSTGRQLAEPTAYVEAVLGPGEGGRSHQRRLK